MTKQELAQLRSLIRRTRENVAAVVRGEADHVQLAGCLDALDEAFSTLDPDRRRPLTPLGGRIMEAAAVVGLDPYRIEKALGDELPSGALTRLLHHNVKQVRLDVLTRIADLIGCELQWLQFGTGDQRTKPIPPGVLAARAFGATEEAIRTVREKHASEPWTEEEWMVAFLAMTKQIRDEGAPPSDTLARRR